MGTAGLSVADVQAIAHLFEVLPFVVIGAIAMFVFFFFTGAKTKARTDEDDYERFLRGERDVFTSRFEP